MLRFLKLRSDAILPTRSNPWDAGLDLYAVEDTELPYGRVTPVRTGLATAVPQGTAGLVTTRSGYGKRGIFVANSPGVIDAGYRGEIFVMLFNQEFDAFEKRNGWSIRSYKVTRGDRIAQLVVTPFYELNPTFATSLPPSDGRDEGGFGSTGN